MNTDIVIELGTVQTGFPNGEAEVKLTYRPLRGDLKYGGEIHIRVAESDSISAMKLAAVEKAIQVFRIAAESLGSIGLSQPT
jgi:hypothetical protein